MFAVRWKEGKNTAKDIGREEQHKSEGDSYFQLLQLFPWIVGHIQESSIIKNEKPSYFTWVLNHRATTQGWVTLTISVY